MPMASPPLPENDENVKMRMRLCVSVPVPVCVCVLCVCEGCQGSRIVNWLLLLLSSSLYA